jgi:hypothetical protein
MMNRPMHDPKNRKGIDESTDTYDTIDWLAKMFQRTTAVSEFAAFLRWLAFGGGDDQCPPGVESFIAASSDDRHMARR